MSLRQTQLKTAIQIRNFAAMADLIERFIYSFSPLPLPRFHSLIRLLMCLSRYIYIFFLLLIGRTGTVTNNNARRPAPINYRTTGRMK